MRVVSRPHHGDGVCWDASPLNTPLVTADRGALRLKQHSQKVRTEPLRPWEDAPAA